jgi:hypothetical protein
MAITLNPPLANLGIVAPALGPWFSQNVTLNTLAPGQSLRLPLTFGAATHWLPPATGTLSLFIANPASPPAPIAHLQDADGTWPFANGRLVAYFRLLPEVEARLDELMRLVPAATASPITTAPTAPGPASTRARVRALAIVLQLPALTDANVLGLFTGAEAPPGDNNTERIAALGLALTGGTNVVNGAVPMTWLRRPGVFNGAQDRMLVGLTGAADLWAFDHRGRAVDAGAVAAWWSWLLSTAVGDDPATGATDYQLLAPGITAGALPQINGLPAVTAVQSGLTVHLVDPHEGPLAAPFLNDRLQSGGSAVTANLLAASATTGQAFTFSALTPPGTTPPPDNPQVDSAPRARIAVLPDGNYGTTAAVWPGGPVHAGLARDFVRVAVLDEERHLLGVARRDSRQAAASADDRRASSQNRPSTRTSVSRTAGTAPVLLATADAASGALLQLFTAGNPTRAVLGAADLAWGPTPTGLATIAAAPGYPPNLSDNAALSPATYRVRALAGGGTAAEDRQAVLVEVNLGNAGFAGAWVRAWPLGFDLRTGLHFRLTGGGGRVDASGTAHLVMTLANGRVDAVGLLGMDMIVAHLDGNGTVVQRSYADRRFTRPAPDAGAAANAGAFAGGTSWVICETGQTATGPLPNGSVPPGGTVVVLSGAVPAIADRTTIPPAAWQTGGTLGGTIQVGDIVSLTETAFGSTPDRADILGRPLPRESTTGDPTGGLGAVPGVIVHRVGRAPLAGSILASSAPYTLQDRLEVAAARTQGAGAPVAVLGGAPPLPWVHEALPHFLGHPGAPAAIEIHGTGVALDGPPAVAVAEYVRERTAGLGFGFVQTATEPARSVLTQSELAVVAEAATPLPAGAASTAAGSVVAVLRTGPVGQEGLAGAAAGAVTSNLFPFSQSEDQLEGWLDTTFQDITNAIGTGGAGQELRNAAAGQIDSMTRALDRRVQAAAFGAREVATSLAAAFARAQDLIYIETPALDNLTHGPSGDTANLWQALITRMGQRRGLRLVVCVPTLLLPGVPEMLQSVRNSALIDALDAMRAAAGDRVAVFSPGAGAGRAVRLATTTVVVDDVLAITGTTHLWRRGLTWDSSLAAAVFDERVTDGRSSEVRAFRLQLLADRLGLPSTRIPLDAAELVRAIRDFDERGSVRRSATAIIKPETPVTTGDQDTWNPDGTESDLTFTDIATRFAAAVALTDTEHAIVEG